MECPAHSSVWWTSRHRSLPHHTGEVLIKRALRQSKKIWRCTFKPIIHLTPLCQSKRQLVCDVMDLGNWFDIDRHIIQIQKAIFDNVGLGWYNVMDVVCQLWMHDENDCCVIYRFIWEYDKLNSRIKVKKDDTRWSYRMTSLRVRIMGGLTP